jgi:hypothetical protein
MCSQPPPQLYDVIVEPLCDLAPPGVKALRSSRVQRKKMLSVSEIR